MTDCANGRRVKYRPPGDGQSDDNVMQPVKTLRQNVLLHSDGDERLGIIRGLEVQYTVCGSQDSVQKLH